MPMFKKQMIVVLVIALGAIVGTMYGLQDRGEVVKLDNPAPTKAVKAELHEAAAGKIFVYVTGAVNNPGMVELEGEELRAADAVNACGGLLPTADVDKFNMSEKLGDGQHLRVPERQLTRSVSEPSGKRGVSSDGMVNINTADIDELDTLPGIGKSTAQKIVDYREINGAFQSIEDIQNVSGIGAKKFEKLKDRIRI